MIVPEEPAHISFFKSAVALAPSLKVDLMPLDVHDADQIERV